MGEKEQLPPRLFYYYVILSGLLLLVLVLLLKPKPIAFSSNALNQLGTGLVTIAAIALLTERAIELLMSVWRAPEADHMDQEITELAKPLSAMNEEETKNLAGLKKERSAYKTKTRFYTVPLSLLLGLVVSAVGVRILEPIVTSGSLKSMAAWQKSTFIILDIFLTGCLIAGGSDGVHSVTNAVKSLADTTTKLAKKQAAITSKDQT